MDVPFSNKFLMPCCVGCSTDDDYDDFNNKKQKWPKLIFLGTIINEIPASGRGMVRGKMLHFVAFFVNFDKLIRRPPGPLWEGGSKAVNFSKQSSDLVAGSFPYC